MGTICMTCSLYELYFCSSMNGYGWFWPFGFIAPKNLIYLSFQSFYFERHLSSPEDRITSIKHCAPRISSKMATIDEFVLKNIVLWWRYGISRHCDEWKYLIIGRIFESEIILIPPSLKISESTSNGSYRNTIVTTRPFSLPCK